MTANVKTDWDTTPDLFEPLQAEVTTPEQWLELAELVQSNDERRLNHALFATGNNPNIVQALHFDFSNPEINGTKYHEPLLLPLCNGKGELKQVAIMELGKRTQIHPEHKPRAFARFGSFEQSKPIFIAYDLHTALKLADNGYSVAFCVSSEELSNEVKNEFSNHECRLIKSVCSQLSKAGFNRLYMVSYSQVYPKLHDALKNAVASYKVRFIDSDLDIVFMDNAEVQELIDEALQKDESARNEKGLNTTTDIQALKSVRKQITQQNNYSPTWDALLPLSQNIELKPNPYPIDALPTLIKDASIAISEYVQAPIAMTVQCVLATATHLAQRSVNAPKPNDVCGIGEPCSLFLLTEGKSGSRKSSSMSLANKVITEHERKAYNDYKAELEAWESELNALPSKKEQGAFLADNPKPCDPSSIFNDVTFESLSALYIDGNIVNASISSDEAGQFFGGHTMKGDTARNALGGFTKLFDDGSTQRTRGKSNINGSGRADDVRLAFNLQGQHEVLSDALKDPLLREQGFLPRFILTVPENLAGQRTQDSAFRNKTRHTNKDPRLIAYWQRCTELLPLFDYERKSQQIDSDTPARPIIPMSDEANTVELDFYNECERLQAKGKRYEYIQPFASRAPQLARRLATVLAYFEVQSIITGEIMQSACEVLRHSLSEWLRYAEVETLKKSDAQELLDWLLKQNEEKILKSSIRQYAPSKFRNGVIYNEILTHLIDANYIQIEQINNKDYIIFNPYCRKTC
ncbi:YfjI family protein [Acinetobacter sp. A3.8]|uniref:YfjI family protein n=1 Tax=Acinetobacter sedimenti TaxID=2919922 RepID=A0A9X1WY38_9GAMM|nr:DUF3987 domain-containing protein [Acinetobacter sedimenti]MCJ8146623.1 YfjI family protein [Acinetobacter sedimenti]